MLMHAVRVITTNPLITRNSPPTLPAERPLPMSVIKLSRLVLLIAATQNHTAFSRYKKCDLFVSDVGRVSQQAVNSLLTHFKKWARILERCVV